MGGAACARWGGPFLLQRTRQQTGERMAKTPVTEKVLVERIRQKLQKQDRDLCVATPEKQKELKLGRYYTVGPDGAVTDPDVELELLARDVGVLNPSEELKD